MNGLGLFESANVAAWGVGEWAVVLGVGYVAVSLYEDSKTVTSKVRSKAGKVTKSTKKAATKSVNYVGTLTTVAIVAAAGYIAYQYFSNASAATAAGS